MQRKGDLVLIMCGEKPNKTRTQLCALRLEMAERLGLRNKKQIRMFVDC